MYMEHECAGISGRSPAEAEIIRRNRPEIIRRTCETAQVPCEDDGREDNDEDPEYLIEFRVFVFNGLEHGEPSFAVIYWNLCR